MAKIIPFADDPTGEEQEKVAKLDMLYAQADALRRQFEPDWVSNILFLSGNQWEKAADDVRRFRRVVIRKPSSGKIKMVSNQILPLARQASSALRENMAQQVAIAATTDPLDLDAAELSTDLLQGRYFEDNEDDTRFIEILWTMCCGRTARKTFWNPDLDYQGLTGKRVPGGDIETVSLNPFRFHLCPWADSLAPIPWIIESDVRDIDYINDMFPGHDVKEEEYTEATRSLDRLLTNIVTEGNEPTPAKRKGAAILKRLYAAPTPDNPKGKLYIWANGKLLQTGTLPEGELPFVFLDWLPIPGRVYPLPFITPMRDLQKEINLTLCQLIDLKNRQLRGDILVRGVGEVTQEVNCETGQKIVRVPPSILEWSFIQYNLNPTEAESLLARFWNDMMQTAGIHESALGQNPPTAATATQVAMLKESDLAGLTIFRSNFDLSHSKIARQKLVIAKNHYKTPRLVRVVGESNALRVTAFYGSDLRNTEDVRPRSVPMVSETMKMRLRSEAVAMGLYGPYAGPQDMFAKITALLNSGIPGVRDEVDEMLTPLTYEDLRKLSGELNAIQGQLAIMQAEGAIQQQMMGQAMMEAQAGQAVAAMQGPAQAPTMPMDGVNHHRPIAEQMPMDIELGGSPVGGDVRDIPG